MHIKFTKSDGRSVPGLWFLCYFARVVIIKLDLRCPVHHRSSILSGSLNNLLLLPQNEIPTPSTTIGDCEEIERQLESTVRTLDAVRRTVHND